MRIRILLSLTVMTISCYRHDIKIDEIDIQKIVVIDKALYGDTSYIQDRKDILSISNCLNKSTKEILKFSPNYKLHLITKKDTLVFNINGYGINHNGIWYCSSYNIEDRINTILKINSKK